MSIQELYLIYKKYKNIQTDSRLIQAGDIFFALSGANFNGNFFALSAIEKGACFAVVDDSNLPQHPQFVLVDNVLNTLQQLALYHRQQFTIPFIAITGSNGKTTTKELTAAVLSTQYKTYYTQGNLNNHIGIPLTILSIQIDAEMAIIEMGANHQKEIESYCQYAQPNYGLITNCGKAHLEGFGGIEGVRKGKGELFDFLKKNKGVIFINEAEHYLRTICDNYEHCVYYNDPKTEVEIIETQINNDFLHLSVRIQNQRYEVPTNLVGKYNVHNVVTALAVGHFFKINPKKMIQAISDYFPQNKRSQKLTWNQCVVYLDAYNANPNSMQLAIQNFAQAEHQYKVLLLGSMKELGEHSVTEHLQLIQLIQQYKWEMVVLVGEEFKKNTPKNYYHFDQVLDCKIFLKTDRLKTEQQF